MAGRLSLDATFLVDYQREHRSRQLDGPAHRFLADHGGSELYLSPVSLAEFAEGFATPTDRALMDVRESYTMLVIDDEIALAYASHARRLRASGMRIGSNDLWIGCTSLRYGLPLVTGNVDEFRRIDGLEVVSYL